MNPDLEQLQQRVMVLENLLSNVIFNGKYRFMSSVEFGPGATLGLTGDVAIGNSGSKIGLYGVTKIARQAAVTSPSGGATIDSQARTAIDAIRSRLTTIGITS